MKRKVYLELGTTLIVGFLIGFFVNSIITDKRIKDFSMHKSDWAFWRRALIEVQASEEQKQLIMPIIKEYSEETRKILHASWEQIPPIRNKMEEDIMMHLSEEQQAKIKEIQAERENRIKENIKKGAQRDHKERPKNKGEHRDNYRPERERPHDTRPPKERRQGDPHHHTPPEPNENK